MIKTLIFAWEIRSTIRSSRLGEVEWWWKHEPPIYPEECVMFEYYFRTENREYSIIIMIASTVVITPVLSSSTGSKYKSLLSVKVPVSEKVPFP